MPQLKYDPELAGFFQALDLPYGASMEEVIKRYNEYMAKCRPQDHTADLADAMQLGHILTHSRDRIREAWDRTYQESARGLKKTPVLTRAYQDLDLPFGAPLEEVTRQWRRYLKKCHPDLHTSDQAKAADASELTRRLNEAHEKIRNAWKNAGA